MAKNIIKKKVTKLPRQKKVRKSKIKKRAINLLLIKHLHFQVKLVEIIKVAQYQALINHKSLIIKRIQLKFKIKIKKLPKEKVLKCLNVTKIELVKFQSNLNLLIHQFLLERR